MMFTEPHNNSLDKQILVFVDLPEGELDDSGKGILSEASRLANTLNVNWSVLVFAGADADVLQTMAPYSVDRIFVIEGPEGLEDSIDVQGRLLAQAVEQLSAGLLLLPHNDLGESLAPLAAVHLDAALFTEAIASKREPRGLKLTRQILCSRVAGAEIWEGSTPLVLTVSPAILSGVVLPKMRTGEGYVETLTFADPQDDAKSWIVERIPPDPQTVDVSEAEVMVSAGLGCDAQGFSQVEELTRLLNASLGVTRPAYDDGYAGFERMVGQTGKTVAPRFYLALGISGSMHHLGGIKDSKRVVSVNIDSKAPIFPNSDEGFVADLREVLPLLIDRVKSVTGDAV